MDSLKQMIDKRNPVDRNKFITREYQDYGYRLAMELGDEKHKALYIRLAKTAERALLEKCRTFVLDSKAENKGALFMWKMKDLKTKKLQMATK